MFHFLYANIGAKIKNWAIWIFITEAIGSILAGIVVFAQGGIEEGWWSIFIILFGPIAAWVSSWLLYAFGQIVEDLRAIREKEGTNEEARHRMEENMKYAAEEKSRRKAEEFATREAEKTAKREAEEIAKKSPCAFCNTRSKTLKTYVTPSTLGSGYKTYVICDKCAKKYDFV